MKDKIERALERPQPTPSSDDPLEAWSTTLARSRRPGDSAFLIHAESAETTLKESRLDRADATQGPAQPAVARLVEWATAPTGPRLCALLGDVGMGRTTTAKLFAQELLDLRRKGTPGPLPILFDLREVRITGLVTTMTLDHIRQPPADPAPDRRPGRVHRDSQAGGSHDPVGRPLGEVVDRWLSRDSGKHSLSWPIICSRRLPISGRPRTGVSTRSPCRHRARRRSTSSVRRSPGRTMSTGSKRSRGSR